MEEIQEIIEDKDLKIGTKILETVSFLYLISINIAASRVWSIGVRS